MESKNETYSEAAFRWVTYGDCWSTGWEISEETRGWSRHDDDLWSDEAMY